MKRLIKDLHHEVVLEWKKKHETELRPPCIFEQAALDALQTAADTVLQNYFNSLLLSCPEFSKDEKLDQTGFEPSGELLLTKLKSVLNRAGETVSKCRLLRPTRFWVGWAQESVDCVGQ